MVAAAAWAFLFAAQSFYGAAGGLFGIETFGHEIERLARERDSTFIATVWVTGTLKVAAGIVVLLADRSRRLRFATGALGGIFLVYGGANLIQHALMAIGAIDTPDGLGSVARTWHLVLWDPWWMLGGVLFLAAASSAAPRAGYVESA
jgi:hypothetical protein